ncbi:MAG: hypothetical protein JZU60_01530, partial [Ilumatobacteraceae bacterium]|nr:hypothetical protein [Ilumatobacteraceae bacterium]
METAYGSTASLNTLANVPAAPTVNNATATSMDVAVNDNGSPSITEFCINETGTTKFVQANGTLGDNAVWKTTTLWGIKTVTGLSVNTSYTFKVKARNGGSVETAYSGTISLKTLANVPDAPTVNNATATSMDVAVNANGSPSLTEFCINETGTTKFVQADGTLGTSEVWQTAGTWATKTVTGLSVNASYTFQVKARNGSSVETAYGSTASLKTLANVPAAPTVNNATATSMDVAVNDNGSPSTTEFCINETGTTKFVQANGTLGNNAVWKTATLWGTITVTGLSVNASYTFQVKARNGALVETDYGSTASLTTLANAPAAPTVNNAAATSLDVTINSNDNPGTTEFCINETGTTKFVKADGTLGNSAVWQIAATWGTKTVTGLSVNTSYNFKVMARNGGSVETAFSGTASLKTLANVPDAPTVNNAAATTLDVAVSVNGNPISTEFCINETSTGKYIQANGTLGTSEIWQNAATWGTQTVTGLSTGVTYTFKVKARNSGNIETAYGATASGTTCTNPTGGGTISAGQTICSGATPEGLASASLPSGYGGTLEYQWQVSTTSASEGFSIIASSNAATYSPGALSTSTWYKRLARVSCKADWTGAAESNVIKITVNPVISGNTSGSAVSICYNTSTTLTGGTATGGSGSYTYLWESSDAVAGTYAAASGTNNEANYTTAILTTSSTNIYFRRTVTSGGCTDVATPVKVTVRNVFTTGAIETTGETICYNGNPMLIGSSTDSSGGDGTITYKWESSLDAFATAGTLISGATSATYDPPTGLTATTSYRRYAHDGTCNTSFTASSGTWLVTAYSNFTVGAIETTGETICYNGNPAIIGSSTAASGGDGTITYKWESSLDGFSTAGSV